MNISMNTILSAPVRNSHAIALRPPFHHVAGFSWQTQLPSDLNFPTDTNDKPHDSPLGLLEGGQAIGEPHSVHAKIVSEGRGCFSYWHDTLYFSTSDNSDPNVNGRDYAIALPTIETDRKTDKGRPRILSLGSCQVHDPVWDLHRRGLATAVIGESGIWSNSHCFAEHLQLLEYCRGNLQVPREIRLHMFGNPDFDPQASNGNPYDNADVILAEICTQFEFVFDRWLLNRNLIAERLVKRAEEWGEGAQHAAVDWFWNGFVKDTDEGNRKSRATKLLEFLPREGIQAEVDRMIVSEAHAVRLDAVTMQQRMEEFKESISAPLAIVSHILRYMPDGRPIIWPSGYLQMLNDVCRKMDVPIINPCRLVMRYGVDSGMTEDMGHYRKNFLPVVADEFLSFSRHIISRKGSAQSGAVLPIPLATY